jgi:6-phosphogluconolactonase (cycloisomerase 2 family)
MIILSSCIAGTARGQDIFISGGGDEPFIGKYSVSDGTVTSSTASFISTTGLNAPDSILVSGTSLYVANFGDSTVGVYDVDTGAGNSSLVTSQIYEPYGMAVSGTSLYVANFEYAASNVNVYNATTGTLGHYELINGLSNPAGLLISGSISGSDGPVLYVANASGGSVGAYDLDNGDQVVSFTLAATTPYGLAVSGTNLFVTLQSSDKVAEYNAATGVLENGSFITGLDSPEGLAIDGNDLFVVNGTSTAPGGAGTVGEYDISSGTAETLNASLITGLFEPSGIAIEDVPEPSDLALPALGLALLLLWFRRSPPLVRHR